MASTFAAVGIDVGGTKCCGVVLDHSGEVRASTRRDTPHVSHLVDSLVSIIDELSHAVDDIVATVGLGLPGLITSTGVIVESPNLDGATHAHIGPELSRRGHWRVSIDNDSTAATYAEWKAGAARGVANALMVSFGTGIGGGIVLDGAIRRGAHGFAGELGHFTVMANGHECACGNRGCWEAYASGTALRSMSGGRSATQLMEQAENGDDSALRILDDYATWVGIGLAGLSNIFDPSVIVVGGGVMNASDVMIPRIRTALTEHLYASAIRPLPEIVPAELGETAAAIGAALLGTDFAVT